MTMARQYETQASLNGGESFAPEPTSEQHEAHEAVTRLFESMFDDYVATLADPRKEYEYDTGRTTLKSVNPLQESQPIYSTTSRAEVLETKRADIEFYVKGAFTSDSFQFDATILPKTGQVTMATLCEAFIEDGIARAQSRLEGNEGTDDAEASAESLTFSDVLRQGGLKVGGAVLNAIQYVLPPISKPIQTISPAHTSFDPTMTVVNDTIKK
jgi:hypothetical protein